ncbi:MAG: serine/threonine protein kinase [Myxococcales bacterium]|nr:serine/threonine protein kinase [Myxococcales bacterium]
MTTGDDSDLEETLDADERGPLLARTLSAADDPRVAPGDAEHALGKQLIKRALFPRRAQPVRIGRFTVIGLVGRGGMGVVYACYDDLLDRKVAVKLLHAEAADGKASARLQREAQALARLSHPNVVAVHDVGVFDERVYLAMEFVDGQTLGAWRRAAPRGWREVLRVVLAAGDGLAAAHAKGLVHRDIKPDNIMIGADGRVRVMDFGLACAGAEAGDARPPVPAAPRALDVDLTRTGALMGTPAYMAGEQFLGEPTDHRTDQFSLCATAWEALHGQPAFSGASLTELAVAVTAGAPAPPPPRTDVPAWLRRVLERGLRARPDERWPDTPALLAALRADPTPRRRLVAAGVTLAALGLGAFAVHAAAARQRVAACEAAGAAIDADWNADARAALERSFLATGKPYAADTLGRTTPWFDRWSASWRAASTATCTARTIDGSLDADLHARALDCLDEARGHFTALVDELGHADAGVLARATGAAAGLPAVDPCTRPELLRGRPTLPPERRGEILAARAALARAASLEAAGRYEEGRLAADEGLRAATAIGWSPLLAQAEIRGAALAERSGDYAASEAGLLRALAAAREARSAALATVALTDLIYTVGYRASRPLEGKVWAEAAQLQVVLLPGEHPLEQADIDNNLAGVHYRLGDYDATVALYERVLAARTRVLGEHHPRVADVLQNLGGVNYARGAYDEARRLYDRALALYGEALGDHHPTVASLLSNLALVEESTGDLAAAVPLLTRALAIDEAALGPDHPQTANGLGNLALVHGELGDHAEAVRLFNKTIAIQERSLGPDHTQLADTFNNLANVHFVAGEHAEARKLYERALDIYAAASGSGHPNAANVLVGLAGVHLAAGEHAEAARLYTQSLALLEPVLGPDHPNLAFAVHGLGATLLAAGRSDEAVAQLERALKIRSADDLPAVDLADTRFALARALPAARRARARDLAEQALRTFEALPREPRSAEDARKWLAEHPDD